jgi:transcriptional regulator of PTS gene
LKPLIDLINEMGEKLGKVLAGLINIFNPELVVLGGIICHMKDFILLPLKTCVMKHSLNLVSHDTQIKISKLGNNAGVLGSCIAARQKIIN